MNELNTKKDFKDVDEKSWKDFLDRIARTRGGPAMSTRVKPLIVTLFSEKTPPPAPS
jgi:hypothetical protein